MFIGNIATAARPTEGLVRVRTILSSFDLSKEMRALAEVNGPIQKIGKHHVEGVEKLVVRNRQNGKSEVVLHLNVEDYLKIVLPAEMSESWPIEALKAQAIASRSYVQAQILNRVESDWDVESTVMDQVFDLKHSRQKGRVSPTINAAVEQTAGTVLVDSKQQTMRAYFHSDCGGSTDSALDIWRTRDGTRTVKDPSCPLSPKSRWTLKLSEEELSRKLEIPVRDIRIASVTPGKRASTIYIKTAKFDSELWTGERFRRAIGFNLLRSTLFKLWKSGNDYLFEGTGYGHGVGMCQWGARQMAIAGKSHEDILNHYYPGYQIKMMSPRYATAR